MNYVVFPQKWTRHFFFGTRNCRDKTVACNDERAVVTSDEYKNYKLWSCKKVCETLVYLLDNSFIGFGNKLHRQIVGISMGTNCAPLDAELFLCFYERFHEAPLMGKLG